MRQTLLTGTIVALLAAVPFAANAQIVQGTQDGYQNGAAQGNAAAGPLGGIVGGAVGAGVGAATGAVGTATGIAGAAVNGATGIAGGAVHGATGVVGSIFGADQPRFDGYVQGQNYPSYTYKRSLRVGTVLPRSGLTYYQVPADYPNAQRYRYARINDRTVLVDPRTRRVVEIMD
ncbi:DUF1236 domain-containing protein [Lichenihabitans sp. Uapishka_5]|uniref:DUF1236 domain-containing protein n=1 Tax=Lichenihabitans sp. Uapishka_5 TaxID=3037302 RepID=UPI0029E81B4F|nr:DUF1236 domain-containing protein [Lichenihabitans sp. Uapishka_5]MDX7952801.1 DUF1236 domain-containing protein [Lichenihabitans sp. Uapishka_5]